MKINFKKVIYIKCFSFDIKFGVDLIIVQKSHVQECLHQWTGLPGDDRTLVPGAEDQGGVVRDVQVQDGRCC